VDRAAATAILDRLDGAQNEFYASGDDGPLRALLDPDVRWTVPGASPIAGTYRGLDEVFAYFADRRDRATGTFRMHHRDVLAGEGTRIAALTDGTASISGADHAWSTVGLYDIPDGAHIAAMSMAIGFSPLAATKFPTGGHRFSTLVAIRCPHWWPLNLPTRVGFAGSGQGPHPFPGGCLGESVAVLPVGDAGGRLALSPKELAVLEFLLVAQGASSPPRSCGSASGTRPPTRSPPPSRRRSTGCAQSSATRP
jgi:ketosteroid isomerase-like protein